MTAESHKRESGLGLTVAAEIALAHAGSLRAESLPGRTRFVLSVPLSPPDALPLGVERHG